MGSFEQALQIYDRQIRRGFRRLRFEPALERKFESFFAEYVMPQQRGALLVAIFLLLALIPLDLDNLKGDPREYYLISRLWIIVPLLAVSFGLTFYKPLRPYFSFFGMLIITTIGISSSALVAFSPLNGSVLPYEGVLIVIMVCFFLGGLYFRQALICSISITASYVVFTESWLPEQHIQYHDYFFMFATLLVGAVSAYALEYQIRFSFLQQGALHNLAQTDPLTGLYNRGAINQKLNHLVDYAFREKKAITLLLLDVDHFKNFNDFYGHLHGDQCLKQVARALAACCKRPLDFAGRYGGEEFLLLWFDIQPSEAESFARRVKDAVSLLAIRHDASATHTHVTISGGMVSGIPVSQLLADKLLHQADQCLYQAKEQGRNRILAQPLGNETAPVTSIL